jgi:histidinol phosphatase-like PHP family hydrolase
MLVELIRKAAKNDVAIEVNSRYHSDPWRLIQLCQKNGAPISLGSDAHCQDELGRIVQVLKGGR